MNYDFDQLIDRRNSDSGKWNWYGDQALPLWVADMDFASPEPVLRALRQRVDHGVFGYGMPSRALKETLIDRMRDYYDWEVKPNEILFLPGLVTAINVVCRAVNRPGEGVLVQTPVYPPFLSAPANHFQRLDVAELAKITDGSTTSYEIDFDSFKRAVQPDTNLFILCHPHNPIGRGYSPEELLQMAEICLQDDLVLCSDEVHSDLLLDGTRHLPPATLAPEIADRSITLLAPSKTFNIPGLGCSVAIVQNPKLRQKLKKAAEGIVPHVNVLGYAAALAAYREGEDWLRQLLAYLTANRNYVVDYVTRHLPGVRTTVPQATYLAWLDCAEAGIEGNPFRFFLDKANVALNDGANFGSGGENFVRLNFGCPRATLEQALDRMCRALSEARESR